MVVCLTLDLLYVCLFETRALFRLEKDLEKNLEQFALRRKTLLLRHSVRDGEVEPPRDVLILKDLPVIFKPCRVLLLEQVRHEADALSDDVDLEVN